MVVLPESLMDSAMKRRLIDYILRQVYQVQNFWEYRHRHLISIGIDIVYSTNLKVEEDNIEWVLNIQLPEELVKDLLQRMKKRMIRFQRKHPLTKRREREYEELGEKFDREFEELGGMEVEGEGDGEET